MLAGRDEFVRVTGDTHTLQRAIVPHHVDDRRRDDRTPRREILGRLGRADEARRLVDRERHQRDIPAGEIGRQLVVGSRAEKVDVGQARQLGGIDLDHRPDHHERPARPRRRRRAKQREVDALVDHAVEAEPGTGDRRLVGGRRHRAARDREVRGVDRGRKGVDVAVEFALGLEEAVPAREDRVGPGDQRRLALAQPRVGEAEGGELVHAVVDDRRGAEMIGEAQHHRRVEPQHRIGGHRGGDEHVEQLAQPRLDLRRIPPVRHARPEHDHVIIGEGMVLEIGERVIAGDVLFPEEHPPFRGEPLHQMLRPLRDEIPPQVRKADQRRRRGLRIGLGRIIGAGMPGSDRRVGQCRILHIVLLVSA